MKTHDLPGEIKRRHLDEKNRLSLVKMNGARPIMTLEGLLWPRPLLHNRVLENTGGSFTGPNDSRVANTSRQNVIDRRLGILKK